ncbi:MAG: NAD(P)-dependent alcohol dehydrogenase [Phenylobacterium sp.]|uniref:NAD(P)-dependent alcohol dehydrogenase n=1 Tax=Phenylobacterium sp. TaxID=1871053 RepID=UPI0025D6CFDE|nr:NAD(P)-dependent alcohol dehydrogenase [Phenylobacterium sp.]MCA6245492.1 NAD(P)-dependent alcohol dehydrogenase [Phenylobacterium sp.]MCA6256170.1 NAD(P)-dependent alcohol dehydrogenase [Phenylobacterium sp.]
MKITAAVARPGRTGFDIESLSLDDPREDEVRVRIAGVGLCHTDLVFRHAGEAVYPLPAVFGHEGSGVVEAVGSAVTRFRPGDRVAISYRSCGACDRCHDGDAPYCRTMPLLNYTGARTDGTRALHDEAGDVASNFFGQSSFASHALTYERNLVKLPDDVPLELMGPLGCGIQTGAGGVMNSLAARAGSSILITGGGSVGLSAVMGAKIQGCAVIIVLEPMASRRDLALELGATHVLDPASTPDLAAAVRAITPVGVDYAFDTTGIPAVLNAVMAGCLGSKGVFGIVGVTPPGTPAPGDMGQIITFGHTVKGIIEGDADPGVFIPQLVEHYKAGRLPFDRMIKTYPLAEIDRAIAEQHQGVCVKAVLIP